ncbi:predicted protein [Histoplasma mississippiense (nom. inval.)]|nr:predicted protein [Histoplasma mississippiense (nom. inval.)]EDN06791.1 predicted protein [Histoplasma mississippiense (nom. inval.)]
MKLKSWTVRITNLQEPVDQQRVDHEPIASGITMMSLWGL